ncbi:[Fe-Fe] hydrogenase large subunit C-terminal domain-containing protein [Acetanaerobacterium elongatum]|uniref:Iron only hydrogenase large subunit, C-terminal domain n=1 Tax=Acetanaerobacterium elongatum TaxID=258515 RepID=A0A1H0CUV7_9FIRM|nr:[Fe-Fe] hydrogenase large subunit C-terminal domain-containing protein [Acetanaerobacterium elongatum]SDN61680.1 Iron only hydrogenase large subunit, C-terminal domain [Acetanaerobacterium elongatum]
MDRYSELNRELEKAAVAGNLDEACEKIQKAGNSRDLHLLDLILHPENQPPVVKTGACRCSDEGNGACAVSCLFDAVKRDENGKLIITSKCTGCGECLKACPQNNLEGRKDSVALIRALKEKDVPVYAMIAPAFSGQFSPDVTSGKLRSAFKLMGFYGMIEVAMFADILSLKEALEFDRTIINDEDFLLTSCCCPLWVALIRKSYQTMIPHVPPSVSPMVACGRSIKKLHPDAVTVFIGPCLAKKAEAREPDISDAVDLVLTFEEIAELFDILKIEPEKLEEDQSDHSSRAGRVYARVSGVSEAVQATLNRLRPDRRISLKSQQADGMIDCKKLLKELSEGEIRSNFIEGMGCRGGCVGGPKSLIGKDEARDHVNRYGNEAGFKTPVDSPYVLDLLKRLDFDTVESLLERDNYFTRIL